jgi:hypothetical protein
VPATGGLIVPPTPPPDYNVELSQLHQRVWQDELGLPATIDEDGWVQFGHTDLGDLQVILREYSPNAVKLSCRFFEDFTDKAPAHEDLMRICNEVNSMEDAKLAVNGTVVRASIYLLLPVQGRTIMDALPDEADLRAVIGPAMSKIGDAVKAFTNELQKLNSVPTA